LSNSLNSNKGFKPLVAEAKCVNPTHYILYSAIMYFDTMAVPVL